MGARASLQDWAAPLGACCAAGAPVGDPVTATDSQGHTITHDILQDTALQSTDGQAEFTIDASTGQIRVAEGTSLNHADAEQHRVQVEASHTQPGHSDDRIVNAIITVVIDVIAADGSPTVGNNPPGFGGSPGDPGTVREVAENAPGGTLVGAPVTATDWAMRRRPLRLGQPVADSRFGEDIDGVSRVVSELAAQALHK